MREGVAGFKGQRPKPLFWTGQNMVPMSPGAVVCFSHVLRTRNCPDVAQQAGANSTPSVAPGSYSLGHTKKQVFLIGEAQVVPPCFSLFSSV